MSSSVKCWIGEVLASVSRPSYGPYALIRGVLTVGTMAGMTGDRVILVETSSLATTLIKGGPGKSLKYPRGGYVERVWRRSSSQVEVLIETHSGRIDRCPRGAERGHCRLDTVA